MKQNDAQQRQFIQAMQAFWKASVELDEVASEWSQAPGRREAFAHMRTLDRERELLLQNWNEVEGEAGRPALVECASINATGNQDCEMFTAAPDAEGRCAKCADRENQAAWERNQERLMEDGGGDDSAYRRRMIDAGRAHLLA